MYKFLNAESTAVVYLPTSRCIYLDQPATIHSQAYEKWRDGWTEVIPATRTITTPYSETVKPAWIEKAGDEYIEHPEETIIVEEVAVETPEQTIIHEPNTALPYVAPPAPPAPTPDQLREKAKAERAAAVEAITVTTQAGNTFDGDEDSQGRMARAIIALSTGLAPSVNWVLADNSVIQATAAELTEALVLSGMAQAALWVIE